MVYISEKGVLMTRSDWNPNLYSKFADLRLQPALDLLSRVPELADGPICDLGCGSGAVGPILRSRFNDRQLIGVDTSPAMLDKARETGSYDQLLEQDAAVWTPDVTPAMIYSNATLHWLDDHIALLPRLAGFLKPGGTLAVQVPYQNNAPSHRTWHDLVEQLFPGRFDPDAAPGILDPIEYHRILSPLGHVSIWVTEYYQSLAASEYAHPVRQFTSSTFAKPVLDVLNDDEAKKLGRRYDEIMDSVYPRADDGTVIFPFRRLFFTLDI